MKKRLIITILSIFLLASTVQPVFAQDESPLTVEVDRKEIAGNETLTLTVRVSSSSLSLRSAKPQLPALEDFNIIHSGSSSQISVVNGKTSSTNTYTYYLQPLRSGVLTIGPVTLELSGKTWQSQPITIQVSEIPPTPTPPPDGIAAPSGFNGQDFYVEAQVDDLKPWQGEAILYTFTLYQAYEFNNRPSYSGPSFEGFWVEEIEGQNQYTTMLNGDTYLITELQSLLFANTSGRHSIEAAQLSTPATVFNEGMQLRTQPIELNVKNLPPGPPENFRGAVGDFNLQVVASSTKVQVNEPFTVTITLDGKGNLNQLSEPLWPEVDNVRLYDSQVQIDTEILDNKLNGSLVYERILVPQKAGELIFPALEYSYFNLNTAHYKTLTTEPIRITVSEGSGSLAQTTQPGNNHKEEVEQLAEDINYLKETPQNLKTNKEITNNALYWFAWLLPLFAIIGNILWKNRDEQMQKNPARFRYSQAARAARKALEQAERSGQPEAEAAHNILTDYLSAKLGLSLDGITRQALMQELTTRNLSAETLADTENFLKETEIQRFAPTAAPVDSTLLEQTRELINQFEKAL